MSVYERMCSDKNYCVGMIGNMAVGFMSFLPRVLESLGVSSFDSLSEERKRDVMESYLRSVEVFIATEAQDG